MFFEQIRRNARRNRKDNGLFFGSMTIAIVAFYTLLSLGEQDVMRFLKNMESDAIHKLLNLIPIVYAISLFFVFFLVYFACKYQTENRRREFGLYLMLGMKRRRMFVMLLGEMVWNGVISLLIGLPVAWLLTESISLLTARLVGLGILGHQFSLSFSAILGTIGGFFAVQTFSMLLILVSLSRKEPMDLLRTDVESSQKIPAGAHVRRSLIPGILLLLLAYGLAIARFSFFELPVVAVIILSGILGTFLVFRGAGAAIGRRIRKKSPEHAGLFVFTGRQIQESIMYRHKVLAVSSLLLTMAIACLSYGAAISVGLGTQARRAVDATVTASKNEVDELFTEDKLNQMVKSRSQMKLAMMDYDEENTKTPPVSWEDIGAYIETNYGDTMFAALDMEVFRDSGDHMSVPYLVSLDSFNAILRADGKPELSLGEKNIAFYSALLSGDRVAALEKAFAAGVLIDIDGDAYSFAPQIYDENLVADRAITPMYALIVPEKMYNRLVTGENTEYWNLFLDDGTVRREGLMHAVSDLASQLNGSGLTYETYLTGIGRNLFNAVAGSYLTLYLGILFTVIANAVIGIGFLIRQRENRKRFATLRMLGAGTDAMCQSTKIQVRVYFGLINAVAAVSAAFGVAAMFLSVMRLPRDTEPVMVICVSAAIFFLFLVIEFLYLHMVEHIGCKEVRGFAETVGREET